MTHPHSLFRVSVLALISAFVGWDAIAPAGTHARAGAVSAAPAHAGLSAQIEPDPTSRRSRYVTIDVAALPDTVDALGSLANRH